MAFNVEEGEMIRTTERYHAMEPAERLVI